MRQAIHIFRKDVRHCWPFIAGVLAITAVHAWHELLAPAITPSTALLVLLMVLAWWLAISAAVHEESTIGDTQFWITRPYSRLSLLAAKALFIVAFLALPLFISDYVVLSASDYNPLRLVPGLLWRQLWFLGFLIVPFVVAALTRFTREFVLTGLALIVIAWIILTAANNRHWAQSLTGPLWLRHAALWLVAGTALALAVYPYWRRRTILIRTLAIATGGLMLAALIWFMAGTDQSMDVLEEYGPAARKVKIQVAEDTVPPDVSYSDEQHSNPFGTGGLPDTPADSWAHFSINITGWPKDLIDWQLFKVTVTEPETGLTLWKSGPTTLFGKRHYVDGRESLTFYDSFSAWSSRKVDASVSVFAKFYDPLVKVAVPPGGAWVHAAGLGSFRLVYDHAGRRLDWRTVPMAGEHGGMFSVDADDSRFQVTPTSLPTSPVWFAMSPVDSFEYHINGLQRVVVMKRLAGIRTYTNKIRGVQLPSAASK